MPKKKSTTKTVKIMCLNCHTMNIGVQDEDGMTKVRCPRCGAVSVSKLITRRHIQVDIYAPEGQVANN